MRSSETTQAGSNPNDPWQALAENIVERCSPLNFDPAALRTFLHTQPAMLEQEQRDALGERIAQVIVDGRLVSPHAVRELAQVFDWHAAYERSSADSALRHPRLLQLVQQRVVPRRRRGGGAMDTLEMAPWVIGSLAVGWLAYDLRHDRTHRVIEPSLFHAWSPLLLTACIALLCIMEFWMMRYDPRSLSAPLTPRMKRAQWTARGVIGVLGLVAAVGTARLL